MTSPTYDTDFYAWTQAQAQALRAKDVAALDLEHLAEEIESLGKRDRRTLESQLRRLLLHLLKYRYDPAPEPRRGWRVTIREARREIADVLEDSPSLQHHPERYLARAYRIARENAMDDTGLPLATFPAACSWSIAQVLDEDFWPET
jgi:Domain of unknown function DUF29